MTKHEKSKLSTVIFIREMFLIALVVNIVINTVSGSVIGPFGLFFLGMILVLSSFTGMLTKIQSLIDSDAEKEIKIYSSKKTPASDSEIKRLKDKIDQYEKQLQCKITGKAVMVPDWLLEDCIKVVSQSESKLGKQILPYLTDGSKK